MHEQSNTWRQLFNLWERTTAAYLEAVVQNPLFLRANGGWLNALLGVKKSADTCTTALVAALGLATKRDQERALHLLQLIDARLDDLTFELKGRAQSRTDTSTDQAAA